MKDDGFVTCMKGEKHVVESHQPIKMCCCRWRHNKISSFIMPHLARIFFYRLREDTTENRIRLILLRWHSHEERQWIASCSSTSHAIRWNRNDRILRRNEKNVEEKNNNKAHSTIVNLQSALCSTRSSHEINLSHQLPQLAMMEIWAFHSYFARTLKTLGMLEEINLFKIFLS